jgi:serine/threonine-protein kinase
MSLAPGQTLAFYEVLGRIGAGGMGEVWRARDTRLEREVAIKVLPESFAADEERLRRFEREARTLASLNHPNVAQIFGIDQVGDTCFLALELVPGEDLAARLARGPLPLAEALDVCRQIAEGLAAAHDAGVVHRDLKPANVCLTPEGTVKLLDFGLAKPSGGSSARPGSSTPAKPDSFLVTEEGLVLGTPTYMSPEQARGRPVDRRTDAWAFGCVLYECLTGERAFRGEALADVLAAIVEREPELEKLPRATPSSIVNLVRRCLVKDPRQRLQHLGEARIALERALREPEAVADGATRESAARRTPRALLAAFALGGVALGALATWFALGGPGDAPSPVARAPRLARVSIPIPPTITGIHPRITPDGRAVVYATDEPDGTDGSGGRRQVLHLRRLDAPQAIRLPGTEHPATLAFAPDGGALAVAVRPRDEPAGLRIVRVILDEGAPRAVPIGPYAPDPNTAGAMAWTDSGLLVTTGNRKRLLTCSAEGGPWSEVVIGGIELPQEFDPELYRALPGGTHVLVHAFTYGPGGFEPVQLAVDVRTGAAQMLATGGYGAWIETGHLLFSRSDALYALALDPATLAARGSPRLLCDGLRTTESWRPGWFDIARDGTLIHEPGGRQGGQRELVVLHADGSSEPWSDERRAFDGQLEVAPDGSSLATTIAMSSGLLETWGSSVDTPLLRPLLAAPECDYFPGPIDVERGFLYYTRRSNDDLDGVWRAPLDAPERGERLWTPSATGIVASTVDLTPDGRTLLVRSTDATGARLGALALDAPELGAPRTLFELDHDTRGVELSPDGRWLAYASMVESRSVLLLRRFRSDGSMGPRIPVPYGLTGHVRFALWNRRSDAEHLALLYIAGDGERILELDLLGDETPSFSEPRLRARIEGDRIIDLASLPDGRLLLVLRGATERSFDRIEVVLGGFELLAR